jgi:hypothetical protein
LNRLFALHTLTTLLVTNSAVLPNPPSRGKLQRNHADSQPCLLRRGRFAATDRIVFRQESQFS